MQVSLELISRVHCFVIVVTLISMLAGKLLFIGYAMYIDQTAFSMGSSYISDGDKKATPEEMESKRLARAGESGRTAGSTTTALIAIIFFIKLVMSP